MSSLWVTWPAVAPLVQQGPDPADVKPGWLGFGVFLALAAAVVLLWLSFRKQLAKIDFEEEPDEPGGQPATDGAQPSEDMQPPRDDSQPSDDSTRRRPSPS